MLIRSATRTFIMEMLEEMRPGWEATSVDADTYRYLESRLETIIEDMVHRHPSKGKTFKAKYVVILR